MTKIQLLRRTVSILLVVTGLAWAGERTALDRYVESPDPAYGFKLLSTIRSQNHSEYVLDLTSQSWRNASEVDRVNWQHWLTIVVPKRVRTSAGLLFIGSGWNGKPAPGSAQRMLVAVAEATGAVTAEVRMVPNEPLVFAGDKLPRRSEDQIIAYTWDKFLRGGDERWPLQLPMTRSAVRAMDAVTAFCKSPDGGGVAVDKFVVTGASKRGWTTWTTAAVDPRVVAIMPMVIDLLNIEPLFVHHWRVYGKMAPAVKDYDGIGIMDWIGTPECKSLLKIVDPYEYRDRYTMPKYLVNSAGDQFFVLDSSQFYFDSLPGEKYLRYVPNTDHSLRGSDVAQSLLAFFSAVVNGTPRPKFSWVFEQDGSIRVTSSDEPRE